MSTAEPAPPVPPITVRIDIGADDWGYVARRLDDLAREAEKRDPATFQMYGGGGGGNYSCSTTTRDVSVDRYHVELEEWRQVNVARRKAEAG